MATDVLAGTLPGFETHTYWMPPVYFLTLAGVFAIVPLGLYAVRLVSALIGALVLLMTYLLGRRAGLGRWLSLLPVALLALDPVFLRGSLVGRMDILAVFFILAALYLALGPPKAEKAAVRQNLLVGFVSALAALTHPIGAAAPVAVVLSRVFLPVLEEGKRPRRLPALALLLAGMAVPLLLYLVYILQDPPSFAAQWAGQIARKTHVNPYTFGAIRGTLTIYAMLYHPVPKVIVALIWLAGLAGLYLLGWGRKPVIVLLICQAVLLGIVTLNQEYWYPLYIAPLTHIGVASVIGQARREERIGRVAGVAAALLALWFTMSSLEFRTRLSHELAVEWRDRTDYAAWTSRISDALPSGSRVLLAAKPDLYLGLVRRRDLTLRELLPSNIPVPPERIAALLESMDYIMLDQDSSDVPEAVREFVRQRCELATRVGEADNRGYVAQIYRVSREHPR